MGLYGTPTKLVKSITDRTFTIEPQRYQWVPFWRADNSITHADGDNITDINFDHGTKIVSHHVKQVLTPETVEPQEIYMGIVKFSFFDHLQKHVCGFPVTIL